MELTEGGQRIQALAQVELVKLDEGGDLPRRGGRVELDTLLDRHGLEKTTYCRSQGSIHVADGANSQGSAGKLTASALHSSSRSNASVGESHAQTDVHGHFLFEKRTSQTVLNDLRVGARGQRGAKMGQGVAHDVRRVLEDERVSMRA